MKNNATTISVSSTKHRCRKRLMLKVTEDSKVTDRFKMTSFGSMHQKWPLKTASSVILNSEKSV